MRVRVESVLLANHDVFQLFRTVSLGSINVIILLHEKITIEGRGTIRVKISLLKKIDSFHFKLANKVPQIIF